MDGAYRVKYWRQEKIIASRKSLALAVPQNSNSWERRRPGGVLTHVSNSTIGMSLFNSDRQRCLRTLLASGATALLGVLSACNGYVEGSDGNSNPPNQVVPDGTAGSGVGPIGDPGDPVDPGRVTLRRLNRAEYNNTVRDLLGTQKTPADTFTDDGKGRGFDNAADSLAMSAAQFEQYATTAESLAGELLSGPNRATVVTCDPATDAAACVRRVITDFGLRAFRRPLTDEEVASFVRIYDLGLRDGGSPDVGLRLVLESMLISPHFLYMVELDPEPRSIEPRALGSYELATRLSHFLWSSTPDSALLQAATTGDLSRPEAFLEQVSRMLDDPRAQAVADNFAGQWLHFRRLTTEHKAEADIFPEWNPDLARSMQLETGLMFRELMASATSPLLQLLTASYTFVDERLAKHYGLLDRFTAAQPLAADGAFRRIELTGTPRLGILGHAGILTTTSMPDRTSPTRRGVFVLSDLLCAPPKEPPPGIPDLPPVKEASAAGETLREQLARHAADPSCNGCHMHFDPIGLGLEQFDGLGRFREQQDGEAIVAAGELPGGKKFAGPAELIPLLAEDERLNRCAVEKMTSYALGRTVEGDGERIDYLTQKWKATGGTFRELARLIATSRAFQMRRGDGLEPTPIAPGVAP